MIMLFLLLIVVLKSRTQDLMQNNTLAQIESFIWLSQPLLKHVRKILKFSIICFYSSDT